MLDTSCKTCLTIKQNPTTGAEKNLPKKKNGAIISARQVDENSLLVESEPKTKGRCKS